MSPGLVNKHLSTLPALIQADRAGTITPGMEARFINQARAYARKNKLKFDGTMKGVFKLAEEADQTHRDYIEQYNKQQNQTGKTGSRSTVVSRG